MAIKSLISNIIHIFDLSWYILDDFQAFCFIIKSSRFLWDIFVSGDCCVYRISIRHSWKYTFWIRILGRQNIYQFSDHFTLQQTLPCAPIPYYCHCPQLHNGSMIRLKIFEDWGRGLDAPNTLFLKSSHISFGRSVASYQEPVQSVFEYTNSRQC